MSLHAPPTIDMRNIDTTRPLLSSTSTHRNKNWCCNLGLRLPSCVAAARRKSTDPAAGALVVGGGGGTVQRHRRRLLYLSVAVALVAAQVAITAPALQLQLQLLWRGEGGGKGAATLSSSSSLTLLPWSPRTTVLLFMVSEESEHHAARIQEMSSALHGLGEVGSDKPSSFRVVVVWDSSAQPDCPSQYRLIAPCLQKYWTKDDPTVSGRVSPTPPPANASVAGPAPAAGWPSPSENRLSHRGYGQETALRWSIDNLGAFEYVWFMEHDVHYTNVSLLADVLTRPSHADLLGHGRFMSETRTRSKWFHADRVKNQSGNTFKGTPLHWSMLNLFRVSPALLRSIDEIYRRNSERWIFFEALLPSTVVHFNLTTEDWTAPVARTNSTSTTTTTGAQVPTYRFRYRPCFVEFPQPGIYHPVKPNPNGTFQKCSK